MRKYQQEVDSLSFRNQQLSTRVLFLQEELDQAEASKKKSKVIGFEEFFLDRNLYHLFQMISQWYLFLSTRVYHNFVCVCV